MLSRLSVSNLAVLKDLHLDLGPGMTVVTGETGSGKSMLIRALRMAAGIGGDPKWIGSHADRCQVEIELDGPDDSALFDEEASVWSVTCKLTDTGRRYASWGSSVSAPIVRDEMSKRLRFVRQGETALLKSPSAQREWLDGWAGLDKQRSAVEAAWGTLADAREHLQQQNERAARVDYERFELEDKVSRLSKVDLDAQAYEELTAQEQLVTGNAHVAEDVSLLLGALSDDDESPWGQLAGLSSRAAKLPEAASMAWDQLVEAHAQLTSQLSEMMESLPQLDVDEILERASQYRQILKRYGPTIDDAQQLLERSEIALAELDLLPELVSQAEEQVRRAQQAYNERAKVLTAARTKAAKKLASTHLPQVFAALGLSSEIECTVSEGPATSHGADVVLIRMRASASAPWLELKDVSGGELSRVAVALERLQPTHATLVLDEIDTGVGGQTAHRVAEQLAELAKTTQVIVVTHLQQVAAVADQHVVVERLNADEAQVRVLDQSERADEMRRMKGE